MEWIYKTNQTNTCRYVLGTKGKNPLICIGLNPSTAEPGKLDPTMQSVDRLTKTNGYDSWIMFNLYPKRVTNPDKLPKNLNTQFHEANLQWMERLLNTNNNHIWVAWGTLIEKRTYLNKCLEDIHALSLKYPCNWFHVGAKTKAGHPHHPLYLRSDEKIERFDIDKYLTHL
jgi:hypothetical protein